MCLRLLLSPSIFLAALFLSLNFSGAAYSNTLSEPRGIADGPGIWVNLWSHPELSQVESYCLKLNRHGIRNVFVQTSRSNTESIRNPERLAKLIETCHRYKIRVIAWSFSMLDSPIADARKLIDAARFTTPRGEKFDSVAANIEKDLTAWKVEKYSQELRKELGSNYPLVAVVFSPLNKAPQVAKTPWKLLDKYYDVIAPMNYWNSKYADFDPYNYTRDTVRKVRALIGRPDAEIHIIGDGMKTHSAEIHEFMRACRDNAVTSASLYPYHKMTEEQYKCMARYTNYFPVNARFSLAAFRQLRKQGAFRHVSDPSKAVGKSEFHRLVVERLTAQKNLTDHQVKEVVSTYKLSPSSGHHHPSIGHKEAYDFIARAVELKAKSRKLGIEFDLNNLDKRLISQATARADKWLIPAAQAHTLTGKKEIRLNYLEASRIILSADSALR